MLHPYREASNIRIPLTNFTAGKAPVRELFSLLCAVSDWLEVVPCVYGSSQGKKSILYLKIQRCSSVIFGTPSARFSA